MAETLKVDYTIGFFLEPLVITHFIPVEEIKYVPQSCKPSKIFLPQKKNIYNKGFGRNSKVNFV